MLTKSELEEIRRELETSRNPLFIFHDDGDGLCSFLLCYRYVRRGHGELIKRLFTLTEEYDYLVRRHDPDKIFILDVPEVDQEFIDEAKVPIIWIDHHPIQKRKNVKYFNPRFRSPDKNFPVSYICYKALKTHMWIGMMGSVSDYYLPDFKDEFAEKYPDLISKDVKTAGEALYKTKLGELIRILSFSLKGPMYKVRQHISQLLDMDDPRDVEELADKKTIEKYDKIKKLALKQKPEGKFFIYKYEKGLPFLAELSNEFINLFPDKIVIIARESEGEVRASIRSRKYKVLKPIKEIFKQIPGNGGGHEVACGIMIGANDWQMFLYKLRDKF
ncbi:MAG: DHH family phosphoesterase [Candidatus Woesearchaeota archaeon]|nr:MAG: DHH family phosphoesterase [Candidatus Woesearchaeota archaeon]